MKTWDAFFPIRNKAKPYPYATRKRYKDGGLKTLTAKAGNFSELEIGCPYARLIVTFIQKPC
jgi:hypothetical protein